MKFKLLIVSALAALIALPVAALTSNESPSTPTANPTITSTTDPTATAAPNTTPTKTAPTADPTIPESTNTDNLPAADNQDSNPVAPTETAPDPVMAPTPAPTVVSCDYRHELTGQDSPKYSLWYDCQMSDGTVDHKLMGYANDTNFTVSP